MRGLAKDGLPQAAFAIVMCLFCLAFPVLIAVVAGYNLGEAAGLFAGSQTISAAMGLATDAINRTGLPQDKIQQMLSNMPVAYAVTYIFGTVGSAFLLSRIIPALMGIDLKEACRDYENSTRKGQSDAVVDGAVWHDYVLRAYKISGAVAGLTIGQLETKFPGRHLFVEGLKRDGKVMPVSLPIQLQAGDILAIGGDHDALIDDLSGKSAFLEEVADPQLLDQPISGLDVFTSHKNVVGKTLAELATWGNAHGVFLRGIKRGLTGVDIPVLPTTKLHRGDVITLFGLDRNVRRAAKDVGVIDEKSTSTDVAFMSAAIVVGAIAGAITIKIGGVPITISTAGGALIAGLVFGWIRSVHPTFGYIPSSTVWFMNSVGLNVFIAAVGLSAGPLFLAGLKQSGISLSWVFT